MTYYVTREELAALVEEGRVKTVNKQRVHRKSLPANVVIFKA